MSKRYSRILGICISAIVLVSLIIVSIVCFASPKNGGNNNPVPDIYTVETDYTSTTQTLEYDKENDKWTISAVPTRSYYNFKGILIAGATYGVEDKTILFEDATAKATFEENVRAGKAIRSVWECMYDFVTVSVDTDSTWYSVDSFDVDETTINPDDASTPLETVGFFASLGYTAVDAENKYTFEGDTLNFKDMNNTSNVFTITITEEDKTSTGDITIKTILDKIAGQNETVTIVANEISLCLVD